MQHAYARIDEAAEAGKPAPIDTPIVQFLGKH
jgi:hypothetical protein